MSLDPSRRAWLLQTGFALSAPAILRAQVRDVQAKDAHAKDKDEDVSPAEDLMREHGILKRVLLIYREVIGRIDVKHDFPPDVVLSSAKLIRSFVEDYHKKLEEDYLFPRFRKANSLVSLVDTLNPQHQKGRH